MDYVNKKLCVPVSSVNGLESVVSDHFGRAKHHVMIDLSSNCVSVLEKENECSEETHGHCLPVDLLLKNKVDLVACKGIGRGAVHRLRENNINVFSTKSKTVQDVIHSYRIHSLRHISEKEICQGHSH